ncbi:MAG: site-2 protease family protein [Candidatus Dasytiphilus stammeri]
MLYIFQTIIVFIITLSVLIIVHKYGHFLIAKRCGVFIEFFSMDFGKDLISWYDRYRTSYIIGIFHFWGSINMLDTISSSSDMPRTNLPLRQSFHDQSLFHRIAIISAGPMVNFI